MKDLPLINRIREEVAKSNPVSSESVSRMGLRNGGKLTALQRMLPEEQIPDRIERISRNNSPSERERRQNNASKKIRQKDVTRNYILLLLCLVPFICFGVLHFLGKRKKAEAPSSVANSKVEGKTKALGAVDVPDKPVVANTAIGLSETDYAEAQELIYKFVDAKSWEDRAGMMSDEAAFREAIPSLPANPVVKISIDPTLKSTPQGMFLIALAVDSSGSADVARVMGVRRAAGKLKIDHQAFARHCSLTYDELLLAKEPEAILRVKLMSSNYYNFGFADESKHAVYLALHPEWEDPIYVYADRNQSWANNLNGNGKPVFVTIKVECTPENAKRKQFLVKSFLGEGWVGFDK